MNENDVMWSDPTLADFWPGDFDWDELDPPDDWFADYVKGGEL